MNSSRFRQVFRTACCRRLASTATPPSATPTLEQSPLSRQSFSFYQRIYSSVAETMSEIERLSGIGFTSNNANIPTLSGDAGAAKGEMKKGPKRPFTVIVEGNIGSGKTTFLQHFSKFPKVDLLTEPVDKWRDLNGYNLLQRMYEDPSRWSLTFQTYVQLTMLQNHTKRSGQEVKMMERSIHSAKFCFVENLYKTGKMPPSEYEVISAWFDFLAETPSVDLGVDLIVYLRTSPEKALERVKARSRGEEHLIPLSYLEELHTLHEDWLINKKFPVSAPVLVIDANKDMEEMRAEYVKQEEIILGEFKENAPAPVPAKKQKMISDQSPLKQRLSGAASN